jgi:protein-tyrosine-phosphatase
MATDRDIVFVCLHGSAKSLIAEELSRGMAAARGLALRFASMGTEPDEDVPPHVVSGLSSDGIDVRGRHPRLATADLLRNASLIVSFGPKLDAIAPPGAALEYWDGLPNVSDGYEPARAAIRSRVEALLQRY